MAKKPIVVTTTYENADAAVTFAEKTAKAKTKKGYRYDDTQQEQVGDDVVLVTDDDNSDTENKNKSDSVGSSSSTIKLEQRKGQGHLDIGQTCLVHNIITYL